MRPPDDVPVTGFDRGQNGLSGQILARQPPAGQVMAALDARLASPPYRLVAHSAHTEATVIAGQRQHCPVLAGTPMLCTVKLSRLAFPGLGSHRLDAVLGFLGIPIPPGRHRAMPDAELTVQVLQRALAAGRERGLWSALRDLDAATGITPRHAKAGDADVPVQEQLFLCQCAAGYPPGDRASRPISANSSLAGIRTSSGRSGASATSRSRAHQTRVSGSRASAT
jgi:DNA polymerase III epsilon subunit-like protein